MNSTEKVIPFPQRTRLLCSQCGAKGEMGCGCGVEYIKASEFAARAVAASPEKSDRAIAEEIGVSDKTVAKARRPTTAENSAVEKRTGRDGKKRRTPTPKPFVNRRINNVAPDEWQAFKAQAEAEGVTVQDKLGQIVTGPAIDPSALSLTAQGKLAAAERQMRRALDAEHAARVHNLDEEVRRRVLAEGKDYLARLTALEEEATRIKSTYREFMAQQTKIFTKDDFSLVMLCVHADASISEGKRNEATRLLLAKRFALTGERQ